MPGDNISLEAILHRREYQGFLLGSPCDFSVQISLLVSLLCIEPFLLSTVHPRRGSGCARSEDSLRMWSSCARRRHAIHWTQCLSDFLCLVHGACALQRGTCKWKKKMCEKGQFRDIKASEFFPFVSLQAFEIRPACSNERKSKKFCEARFSTCKQFGSRFLRFSQNQFFRWVGPILWMC